MPEWELKETSPLKTKWRKYIPAETEPTPSAVNDSFIGLGDSEEELELEPLEVLNTSLDESDDEAKDWNKGNLSDVGKQKRGKSTKNAEIERMVKKIMSRNKDYKRNSKEVHMERLAGSVKDTDCQEGLKEDAEGDNECIREGWSIYGHRHRHLLGEM